MLRSFIAAGLVVAAAVAGIAVNLALLGFARPNNDPVGRLSPRTVTIPFATTTVTPTTTTAPTTTDTDDHGGRRRDDD